MVTLIKQKPGAQNSTHSTFPSLPNIPHELLFPTVTSEVGPELLQVKDLCLSQDKRVSYHQI